MPRKKVTVKKNSGQKAKEQMTKDEFLTQLRELERAQQVIFGDTCRLTVLNDDRVVKLFLGNSTFRENGDLITPTACIVIPYNVATWLRDALQQYLPKE